MSEKLFGFVFLLVTFLFATLADAAPSRLQTSSLQIDLNPQTGVVEGIVDLASGIQVCAGLRDRYVTENETETREAWETDDQVVEAFFSIDRTSASFICRNPALPGLQIEKRYYIDASNQSLVKGARFRNDSDAGFFLKYYTHGEAGAQLHQNGFYFRPRKHTEVTYLANDITEPIRLGHDQTGIHRILLVAPERELGVAHYRCKVDGRTSLKQTSNNFETYAAFLPDGWRFSVCAFYLNPGDVRSAETRLDVFDGDAVGWMIRYRQRPEIRDMWKIDVAPWARDAHVYAHGNHCEVDGRRTFQPWYDFYREKKLSMVSLGVAEYRVPWSDLRSTGEIDIWPGGFRNTPDPETTNLDHFWRHTRNLRAEAYQAFKGEYTLIWWISSAGKPFKEHPEWVAYGRDGQPDAEFHGGKPRRDDSSGAPSYTTDVAVPSVKEHFGRSYHDMIFNFEHDHIYIDGPPTGISRLNWKQKHVSQTYEWIDMYHDYIRAGVREANPQGGVFFNADVFPMGDVNFWELGSWHSNRRGWRWIAAGMCMGKINVAPDAALIPMRWNYFMPRAAPVEDRTPDLHEPLYPNYLLAFGCVPMGDNLTLGMFKRRLPIVLAAHELRGSFMVDGKIDPAWWKIPEESGVEAYTLRRDDFGLVPVIGRQAEDSRISVSFETRPLGLSPTYPVYVWNNAFNTPIPERFTQAESSTDFEPRLPYEKTFTLRPMKRYESFTERVQVEVDLPGAGKRATIGDAGPVQLLVVSSVPAWVYEADGYRYQSALPQQAGVKVSPASGRPDEFRMRVWTEKPGTRIFVPLSLLPFEVKPEASIHGESATIEPTTWDDEKGILVDVPQGTFVVTFDRLNT